nr:hypothetical protein [Mesorhizobium sp. L48C026A00]
MAWSVHANPDADGDFSVLDADCPSDTRMFCLMRSATSNVLSRPASTRNTANSSPPMRAAKSLANNAAHLLKDRITDGMTKSLVDGFEMIGVDEQYGAFLEGLGTHDCLGPLKEGFPVGEACEVVDACCPVEPGAHQGEIQLLSQEEIAERKSNRDGDDRCQKQVQEEAVGKEDTIENEGESIRTDDGRQNHDAGLPEQRELPEACQEIM